MTTAPEPNAGQAPAARQPEAREFTVRRGTQAGSLPSAGTERADAAMRRADERAQAARSVGCDCDARAGTPCGPGGDHLARYLRAERSGVISRKSLTEVIAGLDVIAARVLIQPPAERAARAEGARTAGQVIGAQMDAGMSADRIEASAEGVLGGRFDHPTPAGEAFYRGYDEVAGLYAREARELEAGA